MRADVREKIERDLINRRTDVYFKVSSEVTTERRYIDLSSSMTANTAPYSDSHQVVKSRSVGRREKASIS